MRYILIYSSFLLITLSSCNYKLMVHKNHVIHKKTGLIFYTEDNDYFIPIRMERTNEFQSVLNKSDKNCGFLITNYDKNERMKFLDLYSDNKNTLKLKNGKSVVIIPAEVEYFSIVETNSKLKKSAKKEHDYVFDFSPSPSKIRYNMEVIYIINLKPFYSQEKIFEMENKYLNK